MSESTTRTVTTWFLEQTAADDVTGPGGPDGTEQPSGLRIERAAVPSAAFSRFLYSAFGAHVEGIRPMPWTTER